MSRPEVRIYEVGPRDGLQAEAAVVATDAKLAFIGMLAVLTKNELVLLIVGGLFVFEALSVIIQRGVYKATKRMGPDGKMVGKRVFRMAPIHHHYEKKGWDEPKIIVRFWLVSALLALLALGTLKVR